MHMAIGAVVNAAWDLAAKRAGKPVWRLLADDAARAARRPGRLPLPHRRAHPRGGAGDPARGPEPGRAERTAALLDARLSGLHHHRPAGSATPTRSCVRLATRGGRRRLHPDQAEGRAPTSTTTSGGCALAREAVGPDIRIAIDANQRWDVAEAIELDDGAGARSTRTGSRSRPAPTTSSATPRSAGRVAPIRVATGEHVQNRVVFKQLLQAEAVDVVQIDAAPGRRRQREPRDPAAGREVRRAGLPARRRGRAVRAGPAPVDVRLRGRVAARPTDRVIEYVDHLHEHFVDPVRVMQGCYMPPSTPGLSAGMHAESLATYAYPDGPVWAERHG